MSGALDPELMRFLSELRRLRCVGGEDAALEFLSAGLTVLPMDAVLDVRIELAREGDGGAHFLDFVDGHIAVREMSAAN